jgi:hypothetical protein
MTRLAFPPPDLPEAQPATDHGGQHRYHHHGPYVGPSRISAGCVQHDSQQAEHKSNQDCVGNLGSPGAIGQARRHIPTNHDSDYTGQTKRESSHRICRTLIECSRRQVGNGQHGDNANRHRRGNGGHTACQSRGQCKPGLKQAAHAVIVSQIASACILGVHK